MNNDNKKKFNKLIYRKLCNIDNSIYLSKQSLLKLMTAEQYGGKHKDSKDDYYKNKYKKTLKKYKKLIIKTNYLKKIALYNYQVYLNKINSLGSWVGNIHNNMLFAHEKVNNMMNITQMLDKIVTNRDNIDTKANVNLSKDTEGMLKMNFDLETKGKKKALKKLVTIICLLN